MTNELLPLNDRDEALWAIAKKRASFKKSFLTYAIINIFLWCIWFFNDRDFGNTQNNWPWPLWVTLGWGLGIVFQYRDAYLTSNSNSVQKEYDKLKNNN